MINSLGINKSPKNTRVVVAMSGGVDSSVVAGLLRNQGYEVIGITLKLYDTPKNSAGRQCCAGQDIVDAKRVSENLNIQHVKKNITKISDSSVQEKSPNILTIDSPMVGIIYITPKPSSPPFVKKGQKVKKGDTICLIEAMKTFNEIKSDKDGLIKDILVKNGEAIEFGQPLFEIS